MLRCSPAPFAGVLLSLALLGCSSGTDYAGAVYDACYSVEDCVLTATYCEELELDFAGVLYGNAICTLACETEGSLSPDCPRAYVGRFGSCYPSRVAGGIDDALLCFEPCDFDTDCQYGFRCLDAEDLCGADIGSCPIDEGDAICTPGPD